MFRFLIAFFMGLVSLHAQAQDVSGTGRGDPVTLDLGRDHFAAGTNVTASRPVTGDLLAAGRAVVLDGNVGGDAVLAGGSVRLNGNVSQNAYAAGGQVFVNGTVSRNARFAGGQVEIAPSSRIEGGVSIGAGQARVSGSIGGYLQAAGGNLYINGPISGDVEAASGQVELGPNARIMGRLRYRSRQALKQDPAAQVLGGIEQLPAPAARAPTARGLGRVAFWIWTLGLMLVITILFIVVPIFFSEVTQTLESRPAASALLGFVMLVCIPVASAFLFITLIGIPLGLLLIAAYLALLLVGYAVTGAAVGDWVLKRLRPGHPGTIRWRIGAAIAGIFLVAILGRIPWLGGLIIFAALLLGIGAVGLQIKRTFGRPAVT
jgi:cytoskeletal protein CcmA (bactofilin family)